MFHSSFKERMQLPCDDGRILRDQIYAGNLSVNWLLLFNFILGVKYP